MASTLFAVAIDIGTSFSGWAYSSSDDYLIDPTKVYARQWPKGNLSPKAPTTVLIQPDGNTFEAFGYEAEERYADLAEEGNHERWYYFRNFKMHLHDVTSVSRNFEIKDETGKSIRAMTVFAMAIRFLKEDVLQQCNTRIGKKLSSDDISWVLTVPAIWTDSAKHFMREAAVEAGIPDTHLKLALEPECASVFCRLLKLEKMDGDEGFSLCGKGTQYMVLDAGGGTVDIAVHRVQERGKLQEVHQASGGACGGTLVDEAFGQFIISIVGGGVYLNFIKTNMEDHLHLSREFEIKKRDVEPRSNARITMRFPLSLKKMFENDSGEDLQVAIGQTKYTNEINFTKDKLRIESRQMKQFFKKALDSITDLIRDLLARPEVMGTTQIVMVGGFSESKMLQEAIRRNFPDIKIIVPQEAGLAVLKGAVLYGHCTTTVVSRMARYTYGLCVDIHLSRRHIPYKCADRYRDNFLKFVEVGQSINIDEEIYVGEVFPSEHEDSYTDLNLYASVNKSPKYITNVDCFKIGTVRINVEDMSVPLRERLLKVFVSFGGTEIKVRSVESRTGRITKSTIDFMA